MRRRSRRQSNARTCAFRSDQDDDQLDLQAIHRVRDRLISRRTAVIIQLRAFLLERGMVFAQTPAKLKAAMMDLLENAETDLTPQMRNLIEMLWGEWKLVEHQIKVLNDELERISAGDAGCTRLRQIPGIGPVGGGSRGCRAA
jgi:transposase